MYFIFIVDYAYIFRIFKMLDNGFACTEKADYEIGVVGGFANLLPTHIVEQCINIYRREHVMEINYHDKVIINCVSVIIVPEKAVEEPGYIKTLTDKNDASAKHEFHAMAQMAYFQYQDDELEINEISGDICVSTAHKSEKMKGGLLLYRDDNGTFHAIFHQGVNKKKLLEAAYRFCTRWVRLDI